MREGSASPPASLAAVDLSRVRELQGRQRENFVSAAYGVYSNPREAPRDRLVVARHLGVAIGDVDAIVREMGDRFGRQFSKNPRRSSFTPDQWTLMQSLIPSSNGNGNGTGHHDSEP